MDFINHRIKRLNPHLNDKFGFDSPVPSIAPTEIEQLNNDLFKSIKIRTEQIVNNKSDQGSFEKMVHQMHGQDISNVSDLTKDFERKTKRSY